MQSQYTLTELAQQLENRAKAKADYVVSTESLSMDTQARLNIGALDDAGGGARETFNVGDIAHQQVAMHTDIPQKYYNRLLDEDKTLLAQNVNRWLHSNPVNRMVRTLDGTARAFLSDKYQRIDNEEIAGVVLPVLLDQPGVEIRSSAITERRMYIKATFATMELEVKKGDIVRAGVSISNSEVGMGAVNISPFIERLICTNGMVRNDSKFSARHVGGRVSQGEDVYALLSSETIKADDRAILLKVRDVVRASFDQVRFEAFVETMKEATEQRIEGTVVETVKLLAKQNQMNEFEQGSILRNLIEGGDLSRWGLVNAVTATAKDAAHIAYDRAHELETLGADMLVMPQQQWTALAHAA